MSSTIKLLITNLKKNWIHYKACLALARALRGMSKEKIYQELGLELLQDRLCYRKHLPLYNFGLIPARRLLHSTQNMHSN